MTPTALDIQTLFRSEELRVIDDRRTIPSISCLAEFLRASASILFDDTTPGLGGSPSPLSGRAVRVAVIERLLPIFSFGTIAEEALFDASDGEIDVTAPQLRAAFDALVEIGDFIDVGQGRFYPSRTRAVPLASNAWILVSGSPSDQIGLAGTDWRRRSLGRVIFKLPDHPVIHQSLNSWLGLHALNYLRFSQIQLAQPLDPQRESTVGWKIACSESARTEWITPEQLTEFNDPVVARRRTDEQQPWQRFIARLHRGPNGVECIAARTISYADCSRILHGQKIARGFCPRLRLTQAGGECHVSCDTYFLSEVRQLLLAFSFDAYEQDERIQYRFVSSLRPTLSNALAVLGVNLVESYHHE